MACTFLATVLLAWMFANVEIQIEGPNGWATGLPTWRIEHHWLLDLLWGGRPMTGYHAWVFPFIAVLFHFPMIVEGHWRWRAQIRALACLMVFWVTEDFLWFVLNPAFGLSRFDPSHVPWHKHWCGVAPTDYWVYGALGLVLFVVSALRSSRSASA
nr:hypothetical protein [Luteibacter sp. Sphag1AF]